MINEKEKSDIKRDSEAFYKDKIETELNRFVGLGFNNNVDIDIKNINELNKKAQIAVEKQLDVLSDVFSAREKVISIESKIKKEVETEFTVPFKSVPYHSFSEDILDNITHGRVTEYYNEVLDSKSRRYVLLNKEIDESTYVKDVVKGLLDRDFFKSPSNEYIGSKHTIGALVEYVNQHTDKNENIYKIVPAKVAYQITDTISGDTGTGLESLTGIIFKDKKGDDLFVFSDPYQNYYDSKNNGVRAISVGDERLASVSLNEAKYRSIELDRAEKALDDKRKEFIVSLVSNLEPVRNERLSATNQVLNNRKDTINQNNISQKEEARVNRIKAYEQLTLSQGNDLQEKAGIQFKDAKTGSYFSDRADIEYSFLIEVGPKNKKEQYEIAIPQDAIRPFNYDKPYNEIGEENHINIYGAHNTPEGTEPKNGIPVIFDSKGNSVSYYLSSNKKQEAFSAVVAVFEDIALYNSSQYSDAGPDASIASNNKPLSVEENKIGLINELNKNLDFQFRHVPEKLEVVSKVFKVNETLKPTI